MADEYTPQKVRLKTPETASEQLYLYPVTGLNAITAGTSLADSSYATYIAENGKILAQYLDIMTDAPTTPVSPAPALKVDNNRLSFIVNGSTINEAYLKFILDPNTNYPRIDPKYLPGYVDDVVEVPVKTTDAYPASGSLLISALTEPDVPTTYWFYTKNSSGSWDLGGGEAGKLYIGEGANDGAIYRAAAGNTSSAIKISESPYGIDESSTNGVRLTKLNNNLAAIADLASTAGPGTIQIDAAACSSSPIQNVWLGISGGTLFLNESLADGTNAGIAFLAGTQIQYDALVSAGRAEVSIAPTVEWMQSSIDAAIVGVSSATYDDWGIVKIAYNDAGGIQVSSGIISVPAAAANVSGLVQIVDTINTSATGNAGKAVTQGGIVNYIGQVLSDYQQSLHEGSGIDINQNGTISVSIYGDALDFTTAGELTVNQATGVDLGAVLITGDSSYIAGGSGSIDGKPLAVNPVAVKDYVDYRFNNYTPTFPIATLLAPGAVQLQTMALAAATDSSWWVPGAYDVKHYVDLTSSTIINNVFSSMMVGGRGINLIKDSTTTTPTITVEVDIAAAETALYLTSTENTAKLAIHVAAATQLGVMQVGSGLVDDGAGKVSLDRVTTKEEFSVDANSSKAATVAAIKGYVSEQIAGQRPITEGFGITITSRTNDNQISVNYTGAITSSGSAIDVRKATYEDYGAVVALTDVTSAQIDNGFQVLQAYAAKVYTDTASAAVIDVINQLTADSEPIYKTVASDSVPGSLKIREADYDQMGVVKLANQDTQFDADVYSSAVPTVSALVSYVSNYQPKLSEGAAIAITGTTAISVKYAGPITTDTNGSLTVPNATNAAVGVIRLGNGLTSRTGGLGIVDVDIAAEAKYVDSSGGSTSGNVVVPLGGVRVVSSGGIEVTSGNIYLHIADAAYVGGVKKAATGTAIDISAAGVVSAIVDNATIKIDATSNYLYAANATNTQQGVVKIITDSAAVSVTSNANKVPVASALLGYLSTNYQQSLEQGEAIFIDGTTISVLHEGALVLNAENNKLYVQSATNERLGAVQIGTGITVSDGIISVDTGVVSSAIYVDSSGGNTSSGTIVELGGVRVVESGGIKVTSGNIYLHIADATSVGGVMKSTTGTAIDISAAGVVSALVDNATIKIDTTSNYLYAVAASTGQAGVVEIITNSALITDSENTGKVPVASALTAYLTSNYQSSLATSGAAIAVQGTTVNVLYEGAIGLNADNNKLYVKSATNESLGAVQIGSGITVSDGIISVEAGLTDAAQYVADVNGSTASDGTEVSLGGVRVVSRSGIEVTSGNLWMHTADTNYIGGVKGGTASTGIGIDGTTGIISAKVDTDVLSFTATNQITVSAATEQKAGIVSLITSKVDIDDSEMGDHVPVASAISGYISTALAPYQLAISEGAAIQITDGSTVGVRFTGPITTDTNGSLTVPNADSNGTFGVVTIGSGIAVAGGTISVDPGVVSSAGYVDSSGGNTSGTTVVPLGGVRVVSGKGIGVTSGNLYLQPAAIGVLGGVQTAATGTGIVVDGEGKISVDIDTNVMSFTSMTNTSENKLTVKDATTSSGGKVKILTDQTLMGNSTYANSVPVASAISSYVSTCITERAVTVDNGYGIDISSSVTSDGAVNYTISAYIQSPVVFDGGRINVQTASATATGAIGNTALGVVNVYGLGIREESAFAELTETKASTVPTESAVRLAINAIPYITYELI